MDFNHNIISFNPLDEVDWDDVIYTLEEQKCMLFLGSSIFQAPGGGDIEKALSKWLDIDNPEHPYIQIYNHDGFYLFRKNRFRRRVVHEMKKFYSQPFPETEAIFEKIARIPFSMIFTLTPDNILPRTFDVLGLEYQPDFYFRNRKASDQYEPPRSEKPLIYNLLGNIEEPESIILTHSDFFDFLQSVFMENSMHQNLKDDLESMDRYIFLGLPYEKWYFQLLLRVLSLHSEKLSEIERLALKEFENPSLHKIYTKEFKIEFFPAVMNDFIDELFKRCETKGLLKDTLDTVPLANVTSNKSLQELREMIADNNMKQVFQEVKILLLKKKPKSYNLMSEFVVLNNRYNLLRQRELKGTIDFRDLMVENNQIVEKLVELLPKVYQL